MMTTPTVAEACFWLSTELVAVTVRVVAELTVGATSRPVDEILPALADQFTEA